VSHVIDWRGRWIEGRRIAASRGSPAIMGTPLGVIAVVEAIARAAVIGVSVQVGLVLCVLAGISLLSQQRVASSASRATAASRLSTLYQDARYRVGLEQSLVRKFRLTPDVSVLVSRGDAEDALVADMKRLDELARSPAAKATVARLSTADGAYDQVGFDIIQAVYSHNIPLSERLDRTRGDQAFALVQGIVSGEALAAQRTATAEETALTRDSTSATRAMVIAFALGLGAGRHLVDDDVLVDVDDRERGALLVRHVDAAALLVDAEGLRARPGR